MKHFLANGEHTPDEIRQILEDNSDGWEKKTYTRQLTAEEITDLKDSNATIDIEQARLTEVLNEAKRVYKDAMSPLIEEKKEALKAIRTKHREVTGTVYKLPNYESGMMELVDETGEIIETRRLLPNEKQGRMFIMDGARAVNQ
ncbi:hypothetical protein [Foetidibacter luteolus]|uniref:hypothetical protein n=1 Tax=Foetidibacter luteolus TaxID=2608880 RepID=UPI00129ADB37|nr:hypothetical protein [Foetidibacter luteolus]